MKFSNLPKKKPPKILYKGRRLMWLKEKPLKIDTRYSFFFKYLLFETRKTTNDFD